MEINDAANNEVVLDLVGRQVVIARPEGTKHYCSTGLLLGELGDVVSEYEVDTELIATEDVRPDPKEDVFFLSDHFDSLFAGVVAFGTALVLVLILFDLFLRELSVNVHVLEELGADLVELSKFDGAENVDVSVAPFFKISVVHGFCLTKLVLHRLDDVFGNLALLGRMNQVLVFRLTPLSDEGVKIGFAVNVWEGVTSQRLLI